VGLSTVPSAPQSSPLLPRSKGTTCLWLSACGFHQQLSLWGQAGEAFPGCTTVCITVDLLSWGLECRSSHSLSCSKFMESHGHLVLSNYSSRPGTFSDQFLFHTSYRVVTHALVAETAILTSCWTLYLACLCQWWSSGQRVSPHYLVPRTVSSSQEEIPRYSHVLES
jgi:endogenous inhibitor of DNA gyrase (YacG/DUF329 family)